MMSLQVHPRGRALAATASHLQFLLIGRFPLKGPYKAISTSKVVSTGKKELGAGNYQDFLHGTTMESLRQCLRFHYASPLGLVSEAQDPQVLP